MVISHLVCLVEFQDVWSLVIRAIVSLAVAQVCSTRAGWLSYWQSWLNVDSPGSIVGSNGSVDSIRNLGLKNLQNLGYQGRGVEAGEGDAAGCATGCAAGFTVANHNP